jgi:hypothetical protein
MAGWLAGWRAGWLAGWLVGWQAGRQAGRQANRQACTRYRQYVLRCAVLWLYAIRETLKKGRQTQTPRAGKQTNPSLINQLLASSSFLLHVSPLQGPSGPGSRVQSPEPRAQSPESRRCLAVDARVQHLPIDEQSTSCQFILKVSRDGLKYLVKHLLCNLPNGTYD